jgi:hypothetical protein
MKTIRFVLMAVMAVAASARSQTQNAADPVASSVDPVENPATAQIVGEVPDGNLVPPVPKPPFVVSAKDVLSTTTHWQDGRAITIRRIKPIALPPPALAPAPAISDEAVGADETAELLKPQPPWDFLMLGATVFSFSDAPSRTFVTYWPSAKGESISLWSSANFSLFEGIPHFTSAAGHSYSMIMMLNRVEIGPVAKLAAYLDDNDETPVPLTLSEDKAAFLTIGPPPSDPEILAPIQALHEIHDREFARLKSAYEVRERERLQREAELKANPPRPKNITLNFWRTEKPAAGKVGAK